VRHTRQHLWSLVWVLAKTDFKLRYQGSVLGIIWALLKPLFLFVILNLVFSHLFASQTEHYSLQLLTGIFLWNFFAEATMGGLTSLMNKSHLLTKIAFPRWIIVVAASLQSLMTFLITIVILFGACMIAGVTFQFWQLLMFAYYMLLLYILVLGFSFFAAPFFLRFRDFNQIWDVLLMGGFYAAPIIYPLAALPVWLQPWLYLNPMTFLIEHAKDLLFAGNVSRLDHHLIYSAVVLAVFLFGYWFFRKFESRVVELL